jgi:hypothetical protein
MNDKADEGRKLEMEADSAEDATVEYKFHSQDQDEERANSYGVRCRALGQFWKLRPSNQAYPQPIIRSLTVLEQSL